MFLSFLSFKGSIRTTHDDSTKELLNTIFAIATSQFNTFFSPITSKSSGDSICHVQCMPEEAAVSDLISLLSILGDNNRNYLQNYQSLFDAYKQRGEELVNEVIYFNHLHQVFRTIFYFNPTVRANASCPPEDLAHAISIKFLSLTEVEREEKEKLSFDEFIELVTQGITLGLQMLGVNSGFFLNTLGALVGYQALQQETLKSESYNDMSSNSSPHRSLRSLSIEGSYENMAYLTTTTTSNSTDLDNDDDDTVDLQPEDSPVDMLEDSQVVSLFIEYCGDAVKLSDAKDVLGLKNLSPQNALWFIRSFSEDKNALLSQNTYQKGLLKLVGPRYVSLSVLQRSVADFVIDRLFAVFDPSQSGYCSSRDICCALTLFCGGSGFDRAKAAYSILVLNNNRQDTPSPEKVHLLTAVQCISALLKANCCLDPTAKVFDFAQADHLAVQTTLQYVFNLSDSSTKSNIESTQLFSQEDFIKLFSTMLAQLEGDMHEKYNLKAQSPIRRNKTIQFNYQFSEFGEPSESRSADSEQESQYNNRSSCGDTSVIIDGASLSDESSKNNSSSGLDLDMDAMKAESLDDSEDGESVISEIDPQKSSVYKNDKAYPPSAAVLELRAAQSVLGLENYKVCTLMDSLAGKSEEGMIKLGPWLRWLFDVMLIANVSNQDIKIASNLGTQLFEVFQNNCNDALFDRTSPVVISHTSEDNSTENDVLFSTFAAGLAFLCGGSPIEDKLMVAFTLVDSDSDGFITQEEFKELVTAALKTVTVCSKLIQAKVLHLNTHVRELADMVVSEAMSSLNLKEADELSLEMVCELAEDFLKVAALY